MSRGIDYAFNPHPSPGAVHAAGHAFVGRYVSPILANDVNGKNLIKSELAALRAAGLSLILFAEQYAGRMREGKASGTADAKHFDAVTKALGMTGAVMYAACDFDAPPSDQPAINAYLAATATVLGSTRAGIYGGYHVVKRALDAGKATFACQTLAWSGAPRRDGGPGSVAHDPHCQWDGQTNWDTRAQVRQHLAIVVGGVSVDLDESRAADFGQWPRPAVPKPKPHGYLVADGSLSFFDSVMAHKGATVSASLWATAQDPERKSGPGPEAKAYFDRGDLHALMQAGVRYWVR